MNRWLIGAMAGAVLLAGCDSSSDKPGVAGVKLTAEPPTTKSCSASSVGTVAKISWDAAAAGVNSVKLFARADNNEVLFAAGGPSGSEETGPWVKANLAFVLKDESATRVLATLVIRCSG